MENSVSEIRIYVACLASYNNGILHGKWIDASDSVGDIYDGVKAMLKSSPIEDAEEWAIHDYEGFEGIKVSEYESFEQVSEYANFINQHGVLGSKLVEHLGDIESAQTYLSDQYHGVYKSVSDFAQELTEDTTEIPEGLRFYIDYDAMARDLEINDVLAIETGFEEAHVFWQR